MLKIISDSAWSGHLWNEDNPRVALIKVASNGLSGLDKQQFIKRACASSDELLSKLGSIEVKPGEELAHEIALGATEFYGPNRNGDGFRKEACRKYHDTFVKHGHCYRDHKNTDPKKSYGIVKASAYNEGMGRVELIVAYNGDERAAKANDGLVADKEMEKLASGKDIPLSMACSVPFDVCSYCGNKAETQSEYCTGTHEGGHCKAGGLKHKMGQLVSVDGELHHLHADNTKPDFFDISHVFIPADRIAYSSGRLTKTASATVYGGAELARQACLTAPDYIGGQVRNLNALHFLKKAVASFHNHKLWEKRASFLGVMTSKELKDTNVPRRYKFAEVQRALLDEGICLTPTQYVQLVSGMPAKEAALVGEIIAPLSNDYLEKTAEYASTLPEGTSKELRNWVRAQKLPSVFPEHFLKQAALASVEEARPYTLSVQEVYDFGEDQGIRDLARQYGLYKAAFIAGLPSKTQETAAELIVGRDYLSF